MRQETIDIHIYREKMYLPKYNPKMASFVQNTFCKIWFIPFFKTNAKSQKIVIMIYQTCASCHITTTTGCLPQIEIQMSNQLAVFSGAAACRRLLPNGAPVFWDYENCVLHRFASG
jgi:hypothetical protein